MKGRADDAIMAPSRSLKVVKSVASTRRGSPNVPTSGPIDGRNHSNPPQSQPRKPFLSSPGVGLFPRSSPLPAAAAPAAATELAVLPHTAMDNAVLDAVQRTCTSWRQSPVEIEPIETQEPNTATKITQTRPRFNRSKRMLWCVGSASSDAPAGRTLG